MQAKKAASPAPDSGNTAARLEHHQTSQNIEAVLDFYAREEQRVTRSQRLLERIRLLIGQPAFLGFILAFVAIWMLAKLAEQRNPDQVLASLDERTAPAERLKLGGEVENDPSGGTP
jgi:uncharacterized membrane protein